MSHSTQCVSNPEMEHGKARLPHTCVEKNTGGKACKFATSTLTTPVQSFVRKPQDHCSSAAKTSLAKQGSIATLRVLPLPSFKQIWHGTHTHTHAHTRFQKRFLEQDTHTNTQVALGQPLTLQQRPAWHGRSRFAGCTLTKRNAGQTRLHRNTEGFATSVLEVNLPWNTHTHTQHPEKRLGARESLSYPLEDGSHVAWESKKQVSPKNAGAAPVEKRPVSFAPELSFNRPVWQTSQEPKRQRSHFSTFGAALSNSLRPTVSSGAHEASQASSYKTATLLADICIATQLHT